jgi:hypothetical protein
VRRSKAAAEAAAEPSIRPPSPPDLPALVRPILGKYGDQLGRADDPALDDMDHAAGLGDLASSVERVVEVVELALPLAVETDLVGRHD